tara:strand:+ start:1798 stop:2265 length:468 start_codon:yes stop_codon:yes gene_type:complete
MMIPTRLYVEPNQEKRIMTAFRKKRGCQIKAKKQVDGSYHGEMLLSPTQWLKYQKAANGKTITLPFKHKDLVDNMKHKGGFLPLIAAALAPVIGGIAGGLIERKIAGKGIYQRKKNAGSGLYLNPKKNSGSGIYLNAKKNKGSGLYLNPYKPRKR